MTTELFTELPPPRTEAAGGAFASVFESPAPCPARICRWCDRYVVSLLQRYGELASDHPARELVSRVESKLREAAGGDVSFRVICLAGGDEINAFALPNGDICIHPKLLSLFESEDEVAALIGHELIHIVRGHSLEMIRDRASRRDGFDTVLKHHGLSRIAETEADIIPAIHLLSKAGFNPRGMEKLFEKLETLGGWDPAHGSATDRRYNFLYLIPHVHLLRSEKELIQISESVRDALNSVLEIWSFKQNENDPYTDTVHSQLTNGVDSARAGYLLRPTDPKIQDTLFHHASLSFSALLSAKDKACVAEAGAAVSKCIYCLDRHLERGGVKDAGIRAWAIALWMGGEANVNIFNGVGEPTLFQSLQDHICLGGDSLYDIVLDSVYQAADRNHLDPVAPVIDALGVLAGDLLPPKYRIHELIRSDTLIPFIHADTATLLDPESGEIRYETAIDCLERLNAAVALTDPEEHKKLSIHTTANLLKTLSDIEGKPILIPATNRPEIEALRIIEDLDVYTDESLASKKNGKKTDYPGDVVFQKVLRVDPTLSGAINRRQRTIDENLKELIERFECLPSEYKLDVLPKFYSAASILALSALIPRLANNLRQAIVELGEESALEKYKDLLAIPHNSAEILSSLHGLITAADLESKHESFLNAYCELSVGRLASRDDPVHVNKSVDLLYLLMSRSNDMFDKYEWNFCREGDRLWRLFRIYAHSHFGGSYEKTLQENPESTSELIWLARDTIRGLTEESSNPQVMSKAREFASLLPVHFRRLLELGPKDLRENFASIAEELIEESYILVSNLLPHAKTPQDYMVLSALAPDPELSYEFRKHADELATRTESREELEEIFFGDEKLTLTLGSKAAERYIEEFCITGGELDTAADSFLKRMLEQSRRSPESFVTVDALFESKQFDPLQFLKAALKTKDDEQQFVSVMMEMWWENAALPFLHSVDASANINPEYIPEWGREGIRGVILDNTREELQLPFEHPSLGDLLERCYDADMLAKHLIVRKLLVGEKGLLFNREQTRELIHSLVEERFELEPETASVVRTIIDAVVDVATPEELYSRMSGLLADSIFRRPNARCDRGEIIRSSEAYHQCMEAISSEYEELLSEEVKGNTMDRFINADDEFDLEAELKRHEKELERDEKLPRIAATAFKLRRYTFPEGASYKEVTAGPEIAKYLAERKQNRQQSSSAKFTAVEGIRIFLDNEGQLGARISQIASQYVDLPPLLSEAFKGVFDRQKLQSKIEAYRLSSTLVPSLIRPTDKMSETIAGGSLGTVYKLEREKEDPAAMKVAVPNPEVRIGESSALWERVLRRLEDTGFKPDQMRFVRETLLADVVSWIRNDVADTRFDELDPIFHARWNGTKIGAKTIKVPLSRPMESVVSTTEISEPDYASRMVRLDEWIEGENLTKVIEERASKDEELRSLLVGYATFFLGQLVDAQRGGLVLSNPSPGNARRATSGELAILDRNYYLEFSQFELDAIRSAFKGANVIRAALTGKGLTGGIITELVKKTTQAILECDENSDLNDEARKQALQAVDKIKVESLSSISKLTVALRQSGVVIPLRYTLVFLGINSIDSMFRDAGFNGIEISKADLIKFL